MNWTIRFVKKLYSEKLEVASRYTFSNERITGEEIVFFHRPEMLQFRPSIGKGKQIASTIPFRNLKESVYVLKDFRLNNYAFLNICFVILNHACSIFFSLINFTFTRTSKASKVLIYLFGKLNTRIKNLSTLYLSTFG
jgi:hypothetical protein